MLNTKCVDNKTNDTIILSTQQPEQFNKFDGDEFYQPKNDFNTFWTYSLTISYFTLGYSYRQFDDDKSISCKSLQIEDKSSDSDNNKQNKQK